MSVVLIGSYLSPYVRKLLGALHLEGIAYEIDPIVPFFGGDEEFADTRLGEVWIWALFNQRVIRRGVFSPRWARRFTRGTGASRSRGAGCCGSRSAAAPPAAPAPTACR